MIPKELVNLSSLFNLSLGGNKLSGRIPAEIGKLYNLQYLDLSDNNLGGSVPIHLGECSKLSVLNLGRNLLNGTIPFEIGNLDKLQGLLDLSHNLFAGAIPNQFGKLTKLKNVNLSHNKLNGCIPSSFQGLISLSSIDISHNELEGLVPDTNFFETAPIQSFAHNKVLCGRVQGLLSCKTSSIVKDKTENGYKAIIIITVLSVIALLMLLLLVSLFLHKRRRITRVATKMVNHRAFSGWNFDGLKATENFDDKYCIGSEAYGKVYKLILLTEEGAVKKFHDVEAETSMEDEGFTHEIQTHTQMRHQNIVKLYGFYSSPICKLLVYELMDRGSLVDTLNDAAASRELDWLKRLDIIKGVANALSYMHHDYSQPIVHRDITAKNILLDSGLRVCVSDFGLARFLKPDSSNWTRVAGTHGYIAPALE